MKKIGCLLLVLLILSGCGGNKQQAAAMKVGTGEENQLNDPVNQPGNAGTATGVPSLDPADMLTPDGACEVALNHAHVPKEDVIGLHAVIEIDDGIPQYEVEFRSGHVEYEYHIHAETGEVLSWDKGD